MKKTWKENLPDNCPCSDSVEPRDTVGYRLTGNPTPTEEDFTPHFNKFPQKQKSYVKDPGRHCCSKGVSLFCSLDAIKNIQKLPSQQSNSFIAKVRLIEGCGKISEASPQGHFTWLLYSDVNPLTLVVEEPS